jgi:hypothetical protein
VPWWQWVVDAVGVLLLLLLLYGLALVVRRRWIARDGGTFELSYRSLARAEGAAQQAGRGWILGVGRYSGDLLEFFRIFSVAPGPMVVLDRATLTYTGDRAPAAAEAHSLYAGHVVIGCQADTGPVELAMTPDAVTGFRAWLEAAPPGQRHHAV